MPRVKLEQFPLTASVASKEVIVNALPYTLRLYGNNDDIVQGYNAGETPILRSGIAKDGQCDVEVADQTTYSQTLATLMALRSLEGHGDYNIYISFSEDNNGNPIWEQYAWLVLIDIDVIGSKAQTVRIRWKGTIETQDEDVPSYTIAYNGNGNSGGLAPYTQTKITGTDITLETNKWDLSKTGLTFQGWNTASDGTGDNYAAGGTYSTDADLVLYARWV